MRSRMSSRIARASGALLSATDSPVHTGHANSRSSRRARASSECDGWERATSTTSTHRDDHAEQQPRKDPPRSQRAPRRPQHRFEVVDRHRGELLARDAAVGTDHEGLRLPGGAVGERGLALRVECDRPADAFRVDVAAAPCPCRRRGRCRPSRSRARPCAARRTRGAPAPPAGRARTRSSRSSPRRSCPRGRRARAADRRASPT